VSGGSFVFGVSVAGASASSPLLEQAPRATAAERARNRRREITMS
jgi:outer membrane protein OmpA-like peptidoglycan-associated protein